MHYVTVKFHSTASVCSATAFLELKLFFNTVQTKNTRLANGGNRRRKLHELDCIDLRVLKQRTPEAASLPGERC